MNGTNIVATIDADVTNTLSLDTSINGVFIGGGGGGECKVLYNTTSFWDSQTTLVALEGYIYIYSDWKVDNGKNVAGFKVGNGSSLLKDLAFAGQIWDNHIANTVVHITQAERESWDNAAASLANVIHWLGVTTTNITDGSTVNPIIVNGEFVIAVNGDIVQTNTDNTSFIFNGYNWHILGGGQTPTTLGELTDVTLTNPTNGQSIFYLNGRWYNGDAGGGSVDKVELTQAQYDALSYAEKHNGKLYFITDASSDANLYSKAQIDNMLADKQSIISQLLQTTDKTIVGAINELLTTFYTKDQTDTLLVNKQSVTDQTLATTSKNVVGAINEVNSKTGVIFSSTLPAGQTVVTISDPSIRSTSLIDYYVGPKFVMPIDIAATNGSVTLIFEAQDQSLTVSIGVK